MGYTIRIVSLYKLHLCGYHVDILSVKHKGLLRFIEAADPSKLDPATLDKLRKMISFLQDMEREEELAMVASWKAHRLRGDRRGQWSLFVTRNWRLTFRIEGREVVDLDLENYH